MLPKYQVCLLLGWTTSWVLGKITIYSVLFFSPFNCYFIMTLRTTASGYFIPSWDKKWKSQSLSTFITLITQSSKNIICSGFVIGTGFSGKNQNNWSLSLLLSAKNTEFIAVCECTDQGNPGSCPSLHLLFSKLCIWLVASLTPHRLRNCSACSIVLLLAATLIPISTYSAVFTKCLIYFT